MKILAFALSCMITVAASADVPVLDPAQREPAAKLVTEGTSRFDAKDFSGALDRYTAAYAIYPAATLHYNIALALDKLDRPLDAARAFARFLDDAIDAPSQARSDATMRLSRLDRTLGRLDVTANRPIAMIYVDGLEQGNAPLLIRMSPGKHALRVEAPALQPWQLDVTLAPGDLTKVVATFVDPVTVKVRDELPIVPRPAPPRPQAHTKRSRWWLWTAIGAGVVGAAVVGYVVTRSEAGPESELGTFKPF